ncbi:cell wall-binding repeat-containing protein [Ornithinimicrobium sp. W1665]|uniref:cell wall-binding repeat-containing protein n=1 Tax=Ornithinimicrobium sp. W1665 TaxID=3416666 RepID=UPI003CEF823E
MARHRRLAVAVTAAIALVVGPGVAAETGVMTPSAPSSPVIASSSAEATVQAPTIQDGDLAFRVERHSGTDRYATAAAASRRFVAAGTPVAYVASGVNFPDALSAGPAAALTGGPVLFVRPDGVPSATRSEITRLRPGRIVVVGGTAAVSDAVLTELRSLTTAPVSRIGGTDRWAVSAAISRASRPTGADTVWVASGRSFPDALTAGPAAIVMDGPVLLTDTDGLPSAVRTEIQRLAPTRILLAGGPVAVPETVAAQLRELAPVERVYGTDRFATALAVSRRAFGVARPGVVLASGLDFPDALSAGPLTAYTRGPIMLARTTSLPYAGDLDRTTPRTAHLVGGPVAMSMEVAKAAQRERGVCWAGPDYTGGTAEVLRTVGGTTTRKIAFTLDMGGRLDGAQEIVDILLANQVCTTFFPTSIMAQTTEGRAIMARIAANPHLFELGNHTVHHCDLVNGGGGSPSSTPCQVPMTSTFIRSELTTAESVLLRQTGMSTKPYWRPPYGSTNQFVQDQATAVGYPKTVMWARDTIDWDPATTTAQIVARTTSPLPTSGSIVLAHLGGFRTPDALPEIIRVLRANGYTMTTVSDMRDG